MKKFRNLPYVILAMIVTSNLYADICDPVDQACLSAPQGILSGNVKAGQAVSFINWLLMSVSMVGVIVFGMKAARKMSDEQWFSALGPGVGAIVCGLTTYIAYSVVK